MSSEDGDDELEDRKGDLWSMDEVRGGGTSTTDTEETSDSSDTSDTPGNESVSTPSQTEEQPDTSDGSETSDTSDGSDTSDTESASTTSDSEDATDLSDTSGTTDTSDTASTTSEIDESVTEADGETVRQMALDADEKGIVVRDLHNVNVYLYESVYREMRVKYKELDTEYFAAHGEDLSKNKDFFNAVFRAGLQSPQLKKELEIE